MPSMIFLSILSQLVSGPELSRPAQVPIIYDFRARLYVRRDDPRMGCNEGLEERPRCCKSDGTAPVVGGWTAPAFVVHWSCSWR